MTELSCTLAHIHNLLPSASGKHLCAFWGCLSKIAAYGPFREPASSPRKDSSVNPPMSSCGFWSLPHLNTRPGAHRLWVRRCWWCIAFCLRAHSITVISAASSPSAWDPSNSEGKKCGTTCMLVAFKTVASWVYADIFTHEQSQLWHFFPPAMPLWYIMCPFEVLRKASTYWSGDVHQFKWNYCIALAWSRLDSSYCISNCSASFGNFMSIHQGVMVALHL